MADNFKRSLSPASRKLLRLSGKVVALAIEITLFAMAFAALNQALSQDPVVFSPAEFVPYVIPFSGSSPERVKV